MARSSRQPSACMHVCIYIYLTHPLTRCVIFIARLENVHSNIYFLSSIRTPHMLSTPRYVQLITVTRRERGAEFIRISECAMVVVLYTHATCVSAHLFIFITPINVNSIPRTYVYWTLFRQWSQSPEAHALLLESRRRRRRRGTVACGPKCCLYMFTICCEMCGRIARFECIYGVALKIVTAFRGCKVVVIYFPTAAA